ncbi:methyl-accepting chemotaxis protein [Lachnobacterium bovis]|uniref:methyl-accepting chemotaxis protein n=1 Tax=Lachnobacterium bovis TaxID=140626 RepID=UPI0003B66B23|nr:methyl-accepting chemotaxis protein [Lachnobacterium bovis]
MDNKNTVKKKSKLLYGIRKKFLGVLIPIVVVGFALLSYISYRESSKFMNEEAESNVKAVGSEAAVMLRGEVYSKKILVENLANSKNFAKASIEDKIQMMKDAKATIGGVAMIAYSDLNGHATGDQGEKMERGDRDYIKAVSSTGKAYITAPFTSGTTGKLIIVVACPVKQDSKTVGIVYTTINLDTLSELVGKYSYKKSGYVYVADEAGMCIGFKQKPDRVGKMDLTKTDGEVKINESLVEAFKESVASKKTNSTYYYSSDGKYNKAVFTMVDLGERLWVTVTVTPVSEIEENSKFLFRNMLTISILIIIVAIVIISVFTSRTVQPIKAVTKVLNRMGALDFVSVDELEKVKNRNDETGDMANSLISMEKEMVSVISDIQNQSESLFNASEDLQKNTNETTRTFGHIENAVSEIADGATSQAAETQSATDNVVVIGDMIKETKANVNDINEGAVTISEANSKANEALKALSDINRKTIESIKMIAKQTKTTNESATKIKDAATLIADIADQTNLLSLNASIEAARAGDAGKGFAVVASEIQQLADQSNTSAQQIDVVVKQLIDDSDKSVRTMSEVSEIIDKQSKYIASTTEIFESVENGVKNSVEGIKAISKKTEELDEARGNIIDTVQNLTAIAEENAAGTEQTSAAVIEADAIMKDIAKSAQELKDIANILDTSMKKFKI